MPVTKRLEPGLTAPSSSRSRGSSLAGALQEDMMSESVEGWWFAASDGKVFELTGHRQARPSGDEYYRCRRCRCEGRHCGCRDRSEGPHLKKKGQGQFRLERFLSRSGEGRSAKCKVRQVGLNIPSKRSPPEFS